MIEHVSMCSKLEIVEFLFCFLMLKNVVYGAVEISCLQLRTHFDLISIVSSIAECPHE